MKKILFSLLASMQFYIAVGGTIKMPNEDVLRERLGSIGMKHLVEKTNIIEMLANQEKEPLAIGAAIELSMGDYFEYQKKEGVPIRVIKAAQVATKPLILKTLLKDEPAALEELKACGVL